MPDSAPTVDPAASPRREPGMIPGGASDGFSDVRQFLVGCVARPVGHGEGDRDPGPGSPLAVLQQRTAADRGMNRADRALVAAVARLLSTPDARALVTPAWVLRWTAVPAQLGRPAIPAGVRSVVQSPGHRESHRGLPAVTARLAGLGLPDRRLHHLGTAEQRGEHDRRRHDGLVAVLSSPASPSCRAGNRMGCPGLVGAADPTSLGHRRDGHTDGVKGGAT